METAVISIIMIALLLFGGMTMSQGFMSSVDKTTMALDQLGRNTEDILRTGLAVDSATQPSASLVDFSLLNSGQTKLTEFAKWDFIVHYYDSSGGYYVQWLPYTPGTLGSNQWTVKGIYVDAGQETSEVYDIGILDPREEIVLEAKVDPPVGPGTTNMIVVSTPNGIRASAVFAGYQ